jgi:subtilisin family serine protease
MLATLVCCQEEKEAAPAATEMIVLRTRIAPREEGQRLAPELAAVLRVGGRYRGTTLAGDAVLDIAGQPALRDPARWGGDRERVVVARFAKPPEFDAIDELVVVGKEQAPEGKALGPFAIMFRIPDRPVVVARKAGGIGREDLQALLAAPGVEYVEPNYRYRLLGTPSDYDPQRIWGLANCKAPSAWETVTESDVVVAVLDTGIDYRHPDLARSMWTNRVEQEGERGKDDDGNGYVDDIHGFDFYSWVGDPRDSNGHGTHCAGTIGAVGDNDPQSVVGVLWRSRLMACQVFSSGGNFTSGARVAAAIDYAVKNGAKILNCSFGGPNLADPIRKAVQDAGKAGVLVVAGAGNRVDPKDELDNDRKPLFPASYTFDNVVAVLAIDEHEKLAKGSHYGEKSVDLGAPGVNIMSTWTGNSYRVKPFGTSFATPHVSGALAMVWGLPAHRTKGATAIKALLLANVRKLADLDDRCVTEGTLDLDFLAPAANRTVWNGRLRTDHAALGGETTGTVIVTDDGRVLELDLADDPKLSKLAVRLHGSRVTVRGRLEVRKGVEVPKRRIITVESLAAAD